MSPSLERRLLKAAIAVAGFVPVGAGGWGALGGWRPDGHARYLSGLLLGIGLTFWASIPTIERRGAVVRALAAIVFVGGLARLIGAFERGFGFGTSFPLVMELIVTPLLALWRERVERRIDSPRDAR